MARRRYAREFKLDAVRLVRDQNLGMRQAAQDLDIHECVLRSWVKDYSSTPAHAFPGHGHQKPEQAEITALKREIVKLKTERDILKKPRPTLQANPNKIRIHGEASRDLAVVVDVRVTRCLAEWLLQLVESWAESAFAGR